MTEIMKKMEEISSAFEEFKSTNDNRISKIEKKGSADPLLEVKLDKINEEIDKKTSEIEALQTAINRPSGGNDTKNKNDEEVLEYKEAFCSYLRRGTEVGLEQKALSVGSDPDGGYLVTPTISSEVIKKVNETTPMRQLASVETISSDTLEIAIDREDAGAIWSGGEKAPVNDSATPTFGKQSIDTHELVAQPKATQKLIDDANIDIESWLAGKLSDKFSRSENTGFIKGPGIGQPRGILTYSDGTGWGQIEQINSGVSAGFTFDSFINLIYSLKEEYADRSTFLMHRNAEKNARKLKDSNGQYIWQPSLVAGTPNTILGRPVRTGSDMNDVGAGTLSVAIADFAKAYQIVDRTSIRILRDPYTEKPFIKFYATKRVGGGVKDFDAIKLMKLAA